MKIIPRWQNSRSAYLCLFGLTTFSSLSLAGTIITPLVTLDRLTYPPSDSAFIATIGMSFGVAGPGAFDLAGYQFHLTLSGPDHAVHFQSVDAPNERSYVFAPASIPLYSIDSGNLALTLGDFLDHGVAAIDSVRGIASLSLEVLPSARGTYEVQVDLDPLESFVAADQSAFLPFIAMNGAIIVVPEPVAWAAIAVGLACLPGCRLDKSRRR